ALSLANSEGAALVLDCSGSSLNGQPGDSGIIFVAQASVPAPGRGTGVATGGNPWSVSAPKMPPQATLGTEDYDRIVRLCRQGVKVRMAANLQVEYTSDDTNSYNTIAEIPGTDLKDQIVMIGAHMDSWHSGTGATDNGAGVGCVMEAVRILTALHLQPRRTIRVALWSGEEQGLLGSAAYVREHFAGAAAGGGRGGRGRGAGAGPADPATEAATALAPAAPATPAARGPEWEKLSCYFNLDNGGGRIRGIYGMGNEAAGPLFKKWFEPFADLGAHTVTLGMNGQTDHVSFDNAGLPGFGFIQDNLDYLTRTHHSSADVYDRLQTEDMKVSSTVMAAFLWDAANMDERFPRKPVAPAGGRGGPGGGRGGRGASGAGGGGADQPAQTAPAGG
ncbi:MAG TPA: M20/M25/M40 family metallo-hydrolase, partial [Phycisphaerae bacterium]|nr:M20/M25/M40 family metallo-hydrolase [Phycisphaerae bacterium]